MIGKQKYKQAVLFNDGFVIPLQEIYGFHMPAICQTVDSFCHLSVFCCVYIS